MESLHLINLTAAGTAIRQRRDALGLSQARLASLAELSRATINELETGALKELAFTRLARVLELVGLGMALVGHPAVTRERSAVAVAARMASVSYRQSMSARDLAKALRTGHLPARFRPHIATLLDEAPASVIVRAVEEVFDLPVPRTAWQHLAGWAREVQATRPIWT